jgi:tRNA-dihydrouridine synthase 3
MCGRSDLETLFLSSEASDWIKISEMLLGPVPEGFHFQPKHQAKSHSAEG